MSDNYEIQHYHDGSWLVLQSGDLVAACVNEDDADDLLKYLRKRDAETEALRQRVQELEAELQEARDNQVMSAVSADLLSSNLEAVIGVDDDILDYAGTRIGELEAENARLRGIMETTYAYLYEARYQMSNLTHANAPYNHNVLAASTELDNAYVLLGDALPLPASENTQTLRQVVSPRTYQQAKTESDTE